MRLLWEDRAWEDYLYWQTQNKKTVKKINDLIKDIESGSHYSGPGGQRRHSSVTYCGSDPVADAGEPVKSIVISNSKVILGGYLY